MTRPFRTLPVLHASLPLLLAVLLLAGCAGSSRLLHRHPPSPPPKTDVGRIYLGRLSAEQAQLQAAERRIPAHPHTPRQLSSAIALLGDAMQTLANGLAAIDPPSDVARLHRRLVAITRGYERRLATLARQARSPQSEVAAANAMASATAAASQSFTRTAARIRAVLAK